MRNIILMMLLAGASSSALAEWVSVGKNESIGIYVDQTTVKRKGDVSVIWTLTDYANAQKDMGEKYLSTKDQNEYDCKERKWRRRAASQYSKNMGAGQLVYSDTYTTRWMEVPPDSGVEILLNFACKKR